MEVGRRWDGVVKLVFVEGVERCEGEGDAYELGDVGGCVGWLLLWLFLLT